MVFVVYAVLTVMLLAPRVSAVPLWASVPAVDVAPSVDKGLTDCFRMTASHWKFPNAPHDLGTYPFVTGRDDGGEGMPVEESGNMLILCDAIAHAEQRPLLERRQ